MPSFKTALLPPVFSFFYVLVGLRAHTPTRGTKLTTVFDAATSARIRSESVSKFPRASSDTFSLLEV